VYACLKPGPEFQTAYVVVAFSLNDLRREVIILSFFYIRNIVDHHCLNFLSIITFGKVKNVEKREIVKCLFE